MTTQFDKGRALVIGVADYPHAPKLPKNVLDDAQDIVATLRAAGHCGYSAANVELLLDGQATADGIRQALGRLAQAASEDDTVLFFFSGRGGRIETGSGAGEYLIPFDGKLSDLPGTGISGEELTRLLKGIKAKRLVVLLDACHSAGAADVKSADLSPGVKSGVVPSVLNGVTHSAGISCSPHRPSGRAWTISAASAAGTPTAPCAASGAVIT
jgi:metacaspase-1